MCLKARRRRFYPLVVDGSNKIRGNLPKVAPVCLSEIVPCISYSPREFRTVITMTMSISPNSRTFKFGDSAAKKANAIASCTANLIKYTQ